MEKDNESPGREPDDRLADELYEQWRHLFRAVAEEIYGEPHDYETLLEEHRQVSQGLPPGVQVTTRFNLVLGRLLHSEAVRE